jgi:hypothetical protein
LGATNTFNGNKLMFFEPITGPSRGCLSVDYDMGGGLGRFRFNLG